VKIKEKEIKYNQLRKNKNYQQTIDEANIWTATFFWTFEGTALGEIPRYTTIEQLRDNIIDPELDNLMKKVDKIVENNQFFHWHIEFPEVFSSEIAGFDCVLTNPPWDVMEFIEMEFFLGLSEEIINAKNKSDRIKIIKMLKEKNLEIFEKYKYEWRKIKKIGHFIKTSNFYKLSSKGKLNTYALFTERCWNLISPNGYLGIITPTGLIMNYYMQDLFKTIVKKKAILNLFDFENRNKLFNIDSRFRFCLLSLGGSNISQDIIPMTFYTLDPREIQEPLSIIFENKKDLKEKIKRLPDNHILIPLEKNDFELFNPNTLTSPSFRVKKAAGLLRNIYHQSPILIKRELENGDIISNPWKISIKTLFHMSDDSGLFFTEKMLKNLKAQPLNNNCLGGIWKDTSNNKYYPLYEGRMIWHYNHRFNSMSFAKKGKKRKAKSIVTSLNNYKNPWFFAKPNYWIKEENLNERVPDNYNNNWFLGFREITGATNERTFISTILPRTAIGHKIIILISELNVEDKCVLLSNINSIVFDYIVRQKISGTSISLYMLEQLPIFPPEKYNKNLKSLIVSRVIELVYTAHDLDGFAKDLKIQNEPYEWDSERRERIQADLDGIYAHLYKINKQDLEYILDTFKTLKRKEFDKFNEYRTRRLILEAYDKFSKQKELFE